MIVLKMTAIPPPPKKKGLVPSRACQLSLQAPIVSERVGSQDQTMDLPVLGNLCGEVRIRIRRDELEERRDRDGSEQSERRACEGWHLFDLSCQDGTHRQRERGVERVDDEVGKDGTRLSGHVATRRRTHGISEIVHSGLQRPNFDVEWEVRGGGSDTKELSRNRFVRLL